MTLRFCEIWAAFINNCIIIHLVYQHSFGWRSVWFAAAWNNITAISTYYQTTIGMTLGLINLFVTFCALINDQCYSLKFPFLKMNDFLFT